MSDTYILAVAVGNTTTQIGAFPAEERTSAQPTSEVPAALSTSSSLPQPAGSCVLTTPERITPDEVFLLLRRTREMRPASPVVGCILASVVPALTQAWAEGLARYADTRPLVVGPGLKSGIKLKVDNPAEVGADRIASAVAARAVAGAPAVAVDFGTMTTIEAIDATGAFAGGIIAPGLSLCAQAASDGAARLRAVDLVAPSRAIGASTTAALQAGTVLGEAARADGLIDAVARELGADPQGLPVVISGAHAPLMAPLLSHHGIHVAHLTLSGLALIWRANRRQRKA